MLASASSPGVLVADMCKNAEPQLPQHLLATVTCLASPPEVVDHRSKPWTQTPVLDLLSLRPQNFKNLLALVPGIQSMVYVLPPCRL